MNEIFVSIGRLSLRIMESYLPFNTTVTLICGVHGFEMAVGSHYQIIFSASVSQPSRENLEQYAQVEQVGTKCKSIPAKKKRFQAGCSEGTPDEASYTRTYTLNIVPLRPDDPLQGWVCCFNSCTNMKSKAINIVPFSEYRLGRGRKEGNVLFNDALNTFYFTVIWHRTYGK